VTSPPALFVSVTGHPTHVPSKSEGEAGENHTAKGNPKSEALNPKQIQSTKHQTPGEGHGAGPPAPGGGELERGGVHHHPLMDPGQALNPPISEANPKCQALNPKQIRSSKSQIPTENRTPPIAAES